MFRILSRTMRLGSAAALLGLLLPGRAQAAPVTIPIVGTGATQSFYSNYASVVFNTDLGTVQFSSPLQQGLPSTATENGTPSEGYTVFDFSGNVSIGPGQVITATGAKPLVLLSTGNINKARALAASGRWTDKQRHNFDILGLRGSAAVAEGRGDWKAARTALEGLLEREPANARARQRLGRALFHLGEHKAAYQELERAAREDTALEPAAVSMGWLYTQAGDRKQAQEWMQYAVQAAPDSLAARIDLAAWLLQQGRVEEAQKQAAAAETLDPRSSGARRLLGLAARARRDLARSEQIFQAMAQAAPGDTWVRNQLALVLAEQSDEAKRRRALELAELGARQAPGDPDALATLGTVSYHLRRLDEAEKLLQAVVDSGQGNSDAVYILARVRADRGHAEAAPPLLRAALAAPGLFLGRDEARQWLDRLTGASRSRASQ